MFSENTCFLHKTVAEVVAAGQEGRAAGREVVAAGQEVMAAGHEDVGDKGRPKGMISRVRQEPGGAPDHPRPLPSTGGAIVIIIL